MNRIIKFRVFDTQLKVWVWNLAMKANNVVCDGKEKGRFKVMQFTGLKDKNGKEIFEGDVFNYKKHNGYLYDDFQGEIKFEDGCFGFLVITGQVYRNFTPFSEIDELQYDFLNHIDIVGHVYDSGI